jgi:hypothetical protein
MRYDTAQPGQKRLAGAPQWQVDFFSSRDSNRILIEVATKANDQTNNIAWRPRFFPFPLDGGWEQAARISTGVGLYTQTKRPDIQAFFYKN